MENTEKPEGQGNIDFTPIMQEAQLYAKLMKDIVDRNDMTEDEYSAILGYRLSLADSFCYLMFGRKFDELRKKYIAFVNSHMRELGAEMDELKRMLASPPAKNEGESH